MEVVFFFIIFIAILGIALYSLKEFGLLGSSQQSIDPRGPSSYPYRTKNYLLTQAEKSFYNVLNHWNQNNDYYIFPKIRLADVLYLPKDTQNRQSYWNKIQSKHLDFVICDAQNIRPILAIELDDSSHNSAKRKQRDHFLEQALQSAKLPLVRFPVQHSYNFADLSQRLENILYK